MTFLPFPSPPFLLAQSARLFEGRIIIIRSGGQWRTGREDRAIKKSARPLENYMGNWMVASIKRMALLVRSTVLCTLDLRSTQLVVQYLTSVVRPDEQHGLPVEPSLRVGAAEVVQLKPAVGPPGLAVRLGTRAVEETDGAQGGPVRVLALLSSCLVRAV